MTVRSLLVSTAFVATALCAGAAGATNLLTNGSFEAPNLGTGGYTYPSGTLDSWTYNGAALINGQGGSAWYPSQPAPPPGFVGGQFAGLQSTSWLAQTFNATGGTLNVDWLSGGRPYSYGCCNGDQTYTVSIDGTVEGTYSTVSGQAFAPESFNVHGLTAGAHTLTFKGLDTVDETAFIDNVSASVTSAPEPAVWALMLVGFAGLGGALRASRRELRAV